jgi:hypothetical protein
METTQMTKQLIDFQKTAFNNSFDAIVLMQKQTENLFSNFWGQVPWMTEDGRKQVDESFAFAKKARDDFKKAVDDGFTKLEKLVDQN